MRDDWNTTLPSDLSKMAQDSLDDDCSASPTTTVLDELHRASNISAEMWQRITAILSENERLKAVIEDVTETNKRWQRYSSERQSQMERLLDTIHQQRKQLDKLEQQQPARTAECQCSSRLELREKLHLEHVKSLELQLEAFKEDWMAEKGEKLQLYLEKQALETRVRTITRQCSQHQAQLRELRLSQLAQVRCCPSHSLCVPSALPPPPPPPTSSGQLLSRGTTLSLDDDDDDDGDEGAAALPDDLESSLSWPSSTSSEFRSDLDNWSFDSSPAPPQAAKILKKNASS